MPATHRMAGGPGSRAHRAERAGSCWKKCGVEDGDRGTSRHEFARHVDALEVGGQQASEAVPSMRLRTLSVMRAGPSK